MKKLFPFLKPYRLQLIAGPIFKLSEAVLEIILPTLMALLIDNGINKNDVGYTVRMSGIMLIIATLGAVFAYICQYSASIASQGVGTDIRNAMYKKIQTFSHKETDRFGTPSLINRVTGDVNLIQNAVAMLIRLVIRAPFLCVGGLVMAMILDLKLSVILMTVIPLFVIILSIIMKKAVPLYKKVQDKLDALTLILRENLSGVRVIRAFAGNESERKRFSDANREYADSAVFVGKIAALTNPLTTVIMNLAIAAVIWFGGIRVNIGAMTQGQIIAYINYITQILNAMIVVANLVVLFTRAYASCKRVSEVLETEPSVKDGGGAKGSIGDAKIKFENVSLAYNKSGAKALSDISFEVRTGETIGIIGSTGSGKSSLAGLVPRFYDATDGRVLVDGEDVRDYKLSELRDKIGIVQQKATLFSGTVKENLRMGKPDADDEEIKRAAEIAQAAEFIPRLENGYDSQISQSGTNLSGGQRQRLTIARAIIKNPEILIMDDSASALDYATDAALRKAIKENTRDMTVIIISQRVNTVKNSDRIIVLDDGKIAGIGTHDELLRTCGEYREICISQEQAEEGGGAA